MYAERTTVVEMVSGQRLYLELALLDEEEE